MHIRHTKNVPSLFLVFLTFCLPTEYRQSFSSSVSGSVLFYSLYIATLAQPNGKRRYNEPTSMIAMPSVFVSNHWSFLEHKYWTMTFYHYIHNSLLQCVLCFKCHCGHHILYIIRFEIFSIYCVWYRSRALKGDCGSLALWPLKPGSVATKPRDPRLDALHGFIIWYIWIPDQVTKINEEQLFSTIWKYCLWYNAITTIFLLKVRWPPPPFVFYFYDNNNLFYTFEKFRWNLNAKKSKKCQ